MKKTHTIAGNYKGEDFTKKVEITYEENKPKYFKFFGLIAHICYEELFDWNNLANDNQHEYLGESETPDSIVQGYKSNCLFKDFKIIK